MSASAVVLGLALVVVFRASPNVESPDRPNVLLISIDTLRPDRLGVYGGPASSPAIDALAQRGVAFENTLTHAPLTLPAHASLLTGLYPIHHGVRDNGTFRLGDSANLLSEMFRERGYRTAAFVGAFAMDSRFHLDQGFEIYDDEFGTLPDGRPRSERRAEEVVRSASRWVAELDKTEPFFLFVHLFDAHAPYRPPPGFGTTDAYDGEVAYVDHSIRQLLAGLEQRSRIDETIVVVTADHGEGLGDHGERTHGMFAYETTLRIPLIVAGPGITAGERIETRVRLVDVFPTLVELAGLDVPNGLDGASLVPLLDNEADGRIPDRDSYFEALTFHFNRGGAPLFGIYQNGYKYIRLPIPELYDLRADPHEAANLAGAKVATVAELDSALERVIEHPFVGAATKALSHVDAETTERLSALGYLAGGRPETPSPVAGYAEGDDPKRLVAVADKLDDAVEAYQRGRHDDAIRLFEEVIAERPGVATAYVYLSYVLRDVGRLEEAVQSLDAALERGVDTPLLRGQLGDYLQRLGRIEESISVLAPFMHAHPEAIGQREHLALSLAMKGRFADAARLFEEILALEPDNDRVRLYAAEAYFELGRLHDAERAFRQVVDVGRTTRTDAWVGLGKVHATRGDVALSIDAWRRALSMGHSKPATMFWLGQALAETGAREAALARLDTFLGMTVGQDGFEAERAEARDVVRSLRQRPVAEP